MPPSCSLSLRSFFLALPFVLVGRPRAALPSLSFPSSPRKCGIQQGFYGACGGAESAPVCRDAGCIGEMMRRLAGSSQKPPPSASTALLPLPARPLWFLFRPLSRTRHHVPRFARSPPYRWPLVPSLSFLLVLVLSSPTVARDGIQPPLSAPPPNNHPATAACHRARRRVTESSDYYLICWHEQHATPLPLFPHDPVDRSPLDHRLRSNRNVTGPRYLSPRVQVSRASFNFHRYLLLRPVAIAVPVNFFSLVQSYIRRFHLQFSFLLLSPLPFRIYVARGIFISPASCLWNCAKPTSPMLTQHAWEIVFGWGTKVSVGHFASVHDLETIVSVWKFVRDLAE